MFAYGKAPLLYELARSKEVTLIIALEHVCIRVGESAEFLPPLPREITLKNNICYY